MSTKELIMAAIATSMNYHPAYKVEVLRSAAGYYIGQATTEGFPYCRLSEEYWGTEEEAQKALDKGTFNLRMNP